MDFTCIKRKETYIEFITIFNKNWKTRIGSRFKWENTDEMFYKKELKRGIEGIVYKIKFLNDHNKWSILKQINLKSLMEIKDISHDILNGSVIDLYKEYMSKSALTNSIFTELIATTLTNQLVYQNICPNFTLNYFWDYNKCKELGIYNEYINMGDLQDWSKRKYNDKTWFNILFQIMIGLISIKRYFNMIHSDFHIGNILIQKVKKGGYWIYELDDKKYYLPNLGYQVLLNDFGFAWIPKKLEVDWYYKERLKQITNYGKHFLDISQFIDNLNEIKNVPKNFLSHIKKIFKTNDMYYVYTLGYYKEKLKELRKENGDKKEINKLLLIIKKYPDLKIDKTTTLISKFHKIFYSYNTKPKTGKVIETYSLNKKFDKSKLDGLLKKLVVK